MTLKAWSAVFGFFGICVACSSSSSDAGTFKKASNGGAGNSAGGGANAGGTSSGTGSVTGTGSFISGTGATASSGDAGPTCASGVYQAEAMPVDAYMMFDQSSSMSNTIPGSSPAETWWQAAVAAVQALVVDSRVQNLGLGIQYFALGGVAPGSCPAAQYATPEIEIAPLSTNSAAIAGSILNHSPTTFTPTGPALQGALDHMATWAPAHPGRAPAVVLVTDGFPTECTPLQITDIAALAQAAYTGPNKIRTFVIGFENGAGLSNLNQIAQAGGTKQAFLIDYTKGDVGAQFVNAMLSISNTTLQCDFPLPKPPTDAQTLDPYSVRVYYTPNATGVEAEIPWLDNNTLCSSHGDNGWFYDAGDPTNATKILVCPGTCEAFAAGTVRIGAGCSDNTPIK